MCVGPKIRIVYGKSTSTPLAIPLATPLTIPYITLYSASKHKQNAWHPTLQYSTVSFTRLVGTKLTPFTAILEQSQELVPE